MGKKILSFVLVMVMVFLVGCSQDGTTNKQIEQNEDNTVKPTLETIESTASPTANEVDIEPTESPSVTQATLTVTPTLVPSVDNTQSPSASEPTSTVKPTAEPTVKPTSKPTVKPTATPTKAPTDEELKAYYKQQAANTVEEINKRRNVQLIVLPGLTEYAEYRAKQLETNFAHDGNDIRTAANTLKYGQFVDPRKWGDVGEPFYQSISAEAISINGNPDTVAAGLKRSAGHWKYVGSDEYLYIGVGVSEAINQWGGRGSLVYCVCVVKVNTDLFK